jgi:hypothetical protein
MELTKFYDIILNTQRAGKTPEHRCKCGTTVLWVCTVILCLRSRACWKLSEAEHLHLRRMIWLDRGFVSSKPIALLRNVHFYQCLILRFMILLTWCAWPCAIAVHTRWPCVLHTIVYPIFTCDTPKMHELESVHCRHWTPAFISRNARRPHRETQPNPTTGVSVGLERTCRHFFPRSVQETSN